jgi:hypothetical protein
VGSELYDLCILIGWDSANPTALGAEFDRLCEMGRNSADGLIPWPKNITTYDRKLAQLANPTDLYQWIFEPTPNMFWKNVDCVDPTPDANPTAGNLHNGPDGSQCRFADCNNLDATTFPNSSSLSCPVCNYDTNFEMQASPPPHKDTHTLTLHQHPAPSIPHPTLHYHSTTDPC